MSHFYNTNGNLVPEGTKDALPSPTTILDRTSDKKKLYEWMMRVGVEAASAKQLESSARGTRIHQACEAIALGEMLPELQEGDAAYVNGFRKWLERCQPEVIDTEVFLHSKKYGYAGRCDLIVRIDGGLWIVDIKTGADKPEHGLQLKFYEQAYFEATGEHARMGTLALDASKTCGYRHSRKPCGLMEYSETLTDIMARIIVFRWVQSKNRIKEPVDGSLIWK